jgi:DNA-binding MarR family transcriptional regulator
MSERKKRSAADTAGNGAALDYVLGEAPGHLLRRCQQRAVEIFMEEIGPTRLTPRQFALLLILAQRPGLTQTALVEETGIDRSTVGDMIDRLVGRGLVRRRRSGRDQRANTLAILPAGTAALTEALPAVERAQLRIMAPLPPATRQSFMAALRLMAADSPTPEPEERPARRRR